jgi:hypothetical protein
VVVVRQKRYAFACFAVTLVISDIRDTLAGALNVAVWTLFMTMKLECKNVCTMTLAQRNSWIGRNSVFKICQTE